MTRMWVDATDEDVAEDDVPLESEPTSARHLPTFPGAHLYNISLRKEYINILTLI